MWTLIAAALAQDIAYDPTIHRYYTACGRADVVDLDQLAVDDPAWAPTRTRWRLDGEVLRLALLHPYAPILVNAAVDVAVATRVCVEEDFHEAVPRLLAAGVRPPAHALPPDERERLDLDLTLTRGWTRPPEGPVVYTVRGVIGPAAVATADGAWRVGGAIDGRVGLAEGVFGGLSLDLGRAERQGAVGTEATLGVQVGLAGLGGHSAWLGVGRLGQAAAIGGDAVVGRFARGRGLATLGLRAEWGAWSDAPWRALVGIGIAGQARPRRTR
ncbi:MAG: hypothetical protein ACI8PZ_007417 [Myxococcota bacterium]|jgi:hypothetical protein